MLARAIRGSSSLCLTIYLFSPSRRSFAVTQSKLWSTVHCEKLAPRNTQPQAKHTNPQQDFTVETQQLLKKFTWLNKHAQCFPVSGKNVQVIISPQEFYDTLLNKIRNAKKRIYLASLYIGTGKLEQSLVEEIISNVKEHTPEIKVNILLDYNRGSRGQENSRTLLLPLLKASKHVEVSLFHTPDLQGITKQLLPDKWNEIVGLTHIKVYMFDDDILISGANLSDHYFTHRQDRHLLLKQVPELCAFYENILNTISSISFQLQPDDTVLLPTDCPAHPIQESELYKTEGERRLLDAMASCFHDSQHANCTVDQSDCETDMSAGSKDTWVFPLFQAGMFNIRNDEMATVEFFEQAELDSVTFLASGYFNLTDAYIDCILHKSKGDFRILTASPQANGFYGARGIMNGIHQAYTLIARNFYQKITEAGSHHRLSLHEYYKEGWTFHAKGLWYYPPGSQLPAATFVGSPNFGYRSVRRDTESQVVVITTNSDLQHQLNEERKTLFKTSTQVQKETFESDARKLDLWVLVVTRFIKSFF